MADVLRNERIIRFGKTGVVLLAPVSAIPTDKNERISAAGAVLSDYSDALTHGEVAYTDTGKPFLRHCPHIGISVSHSGQWWMLAAVSGVCGADIQLMERRDYKKIARRFFHPMEAEPADEKAFYRIWCMKEACVKYTGRGMVDFKKFSAFDAAGYTGGADILTIAAPEGYAAAVCYKESGG